MKKVFIQPLVVFCLGVCHLHGQTSYIQNFTTEDLEGNTISLYERLNEGRTVVIFVTTAWSTLAWQYHTLGDLETLYQNYGPNGTGEFDVMLVEAEAANGLDQIMGISAGSGVLSSTGNWTTGTSYPICDDAQLAIALGVSYYPTVLMVCPDRRVARMGAVSVSEILSLKQERGCAPATEGIDAALIQVNAVAGDCANPQFMLRCVLQNKGTQILNAANLWLTNDLLELNYPWTGSLGPFAFDTLEVGPVFMPQADTLQFELIAPSDANLNDNTQLARVGTPASTTHVRVTIRTDLWPGETSWQILDSNDAVSASGGPYTSMANQQIVRDVYLPGTGCYRFQLLDSAGDGLNGAQWGANNGFCRVYGMDEDNNLLPLIMDYDGSYPYSLLEQEFVVNEVVGVEEAYSITRMHVYPNPFTDEVNIRYGLNNAATVRLEYYTVMGELLRIQSEGFQVRGDYTAKSNLIGMPQGVYLIKIFIDDRHIATHRLIKSSGASER